MDLKNGKIVQTKYEVTVKIYEAPHIMVFANWEPNFMAMSLDRWHVIRDYRDCKTLHELFPPSIWPEIANLRDPFPPADHHAADVRGLRRPSNPADFPTPPPARQRLEAPEPMEID